ncbi:MAG: Gfo/Idh/MocA family protein [bacterium]
MVRVAVVGTGYWGPNLVRIMDELVESEIVWVCDKESTQFQKLAPLYPHLRFTNDLGKIISDNSIDAVVVATDSNSHYEVTKACLEHGKHVLVEKPLALNSKDAIDLIETADKHKRILMVGHLLRYHKGIQKLKDYIDQGYLGKLLYVYTARVNLGRIRKDENALWSLGTHDISVANYLVGSKPLSVTASGQSYVRKGIYDVVFVTLHFPGDVMAHLHVSWLDPHKIRKITVVGDKKMAVLDDMETTEKLRIYDKGIDYSPSYGDYAESLSIRIGDIYIPKIDMAEPLKVECKHFLECIEKGKTPLTDGRYGLDVIRILESAERSLREGSKSISVEV